MQRRLDSQYSFEKKQDLIVKAIEKDNYGNLIVVDNDDQPGDQLKELFQQVLKAFSAETERLLP